MFFSIVFSLIISSWAFADESNSSHESNLNIKLAPKKLQLRIFPLADYQISVIFMMRNKNGEKVAKSATLPFFALKGKGSVDLQFLNRQIDSRSFPSMSATFSIELLNEWGGKRAKICKKEFVEENLKTSKLENFGQFLAFEFFSPGELAELGEFIGENVQRGKETALANAILTHQRVDNSRQISTDKCELIEKIGKEIVGQIVPEGEYKIFIDYKWAEAANGGNLMKRNSDECTTDKGGKFKCEMRKGASEGKFKQIYLWMQLEEEELDSKETAVIKDFGLKSLYSPKKSILVEKFSNLNLFQKEPIQFFYENEMAILAKLDFTKLLGRVKKDHFYAKKMREEKNGGENLEKELKEKQIKNEQKLAKKQEEGQEKFGKKLAKAAEKMREEEEKKAKKEEEKRRKEEKKKGKKGEGYKEKEEDLKEEGPMGDGGNEGLEALGNVGPNEGNEQKNGGENIEENIGHLGANGHENGNALKGKDDWEKAEDIDGENWRREKSLEENRIGIQMNGDNEEMDEASKKAGNFHGKIVEGDSILEKRNKKNKAMNEAKRILENKIAKSQFDKEEMRNGGNEGEEGVKKKFEKNHPKSEIIKNENAMMEGEMKEGEKNENAMKSEIKEGGKIGGKFGLGNGPKVKVAEKARLHILAQILIKHFKAPFETIEGENGKRRRQLDVDLAIQKAEGGELPIRKKSFGQIFGELGMEEKPGQGGMREEQKEWDVAKFLRQLDAEKRKQLFIEEI